MMVGSLGCARIARIGQKQRRLSEDGKVVTLPHFYQSCSSYLKQGLSSEHCQNFGWEETRSRWMDWTWSEDSAWEFGQQMCSVFLQIETLVNDWFKQFQKSYLLIIQSFWKHDLDKVVHVNENSTLTRGRKHNNANQRDTNTTVTCNSYNTGLLNLLKLNTA